MELDSLQRLKEPASSPSPEPDIYSPRRQI
jgi:hypothetical protein